MIRATGLFAFNYTLALTGVLWAGAQTGTPEDTPERAYNPNMLTGVALDPSIRARVEEALESRQYDRAEAILFDQYNQKPGSAPLLVLLGRIFFLDGKYENCAIALNKADQLSTLQDRYRFTLAMAYVAMGHPGWARPEIEKLQRANPNRALYPYWLSRLDYHDMRLTEAVTHVQRAIRLDPEFMKAHDNLGLYLEGLGKYDEAIMAYQTAVRLNRAESLHSPWPTHNLGASLSKLGRLDEAELYIKESLSEDPRFPRAYFQLGLLLEKRLKDSDAVKALKQATALDPDYAEPYLVLGKILQRQHDYAAAHKALGAFEKLENENKISKLSE